MSSGEPEYGSGQQSIEAQKAAAIARQKRLDVLLASPGVKPALGIFGLLLSAAAMYAALNQSHPAPAQDSYGTSILKSLGDCYLYSPFDPNHPLEIDPPPVSCTSPHQAQLYSVTINSEVCNKAALDSARLPAGAETDVTIKATINDGDEIYECYVATQQPITISLMAKGQK